MWLQNEVTPQIKLCVLKIYDFSGHLVGKGLRENILDFVLLIPSQASTEIRGIYEHGSFSMSWEFMERACLFSHQNFHEFMGS